MSKTVTNADLDVAAKMLAALLPLSLQGQLDTLAVTIDAWVRTRGRDWWLAAVAGHPATQEEVGA